MTTVASRTLLLSFVEAELFKLRRLRLTRAVMVAVALGAPVSMAFVWLLGDVPMSTLPRALELIYLPLWLLSGLVGLLLTVEVMGSEFDQGTVRAVMARGAPRWLFVGGKAIALFIALVASAVVGVLSGGVFAVLSHLIQVGPAGLAAGLGEFVRSILPAVGIATLAGAAYVGILLLLTALTRSSALAMLGGLLIFGGDFIVASGVPLGMEKLDVGAYSILGHTAALFYRAMKGVWGMGIINAPAGAPGRAFSTLLLYAVGGVALAYYVLQRQDLAGRP